MTLLDLVLQGGALLLGVAAVLILVKLLFIGIGRRTTPRETGKLQEHQLRSRSSNGNRF